YASEQLFGLNKTVLKCMTSADDGSECPGGFDRSMLERALPKKMLAKMDEAIFNSAVRRKRGGTSDFQHELVAHYLNLAPTADAGGLQGLEIVAVTEADVENRQSWDHWNPKPEPDVDATYRFAVAAKVGPPIASEHIRGVGWVGTSMAAAWALDKRNGWCTHCKKRVRVCV
ncbi:hypothetical protein TeGR_g7716, partial [Tetraparma gracilis]